MELTSTVHDTALLFEGGAMRGSYTSALAVAFLEENLHFNFVAGISAGATITTNYVSRDPVRTRRSFVEFAGDPQMGNLRTFVSGDGLFNAHYIYERTHRERGWLPFDFGTYMNSEANPHIGAFEITTGTTRWWNKSETNTIPNLMRRVRSSSTMPILMPNVTIDDDHDSGIFVDGAIGEDGGIPISVAERAGFEKFVVVLTRPRDYVKPPQKFTPVIRRAFKRYPAVIDAMASRAERYNETREKLFEMEKQGTAYLFVPEVMPVSNGERNIVRLRASHQLGMEQARRELPAIKEFLGLSS